MRVCDWPADFKCSVRDSVLNVSGEVYRRLVSFFEAYPWALAPLGDPAVPMERKKAIVKLLFDAPEVCLDAAFSLKVRRFAKSEEVVWAVRSFAGLWMS